MASARRLPASTGTGPRTATRSVASLAVIGLAVGLAACGSGLAASPRPADPPDCSTTAAKLTVGASGAASATPDLLTVAMGVQVDEATATAALSDANSQATSLTGSLKGSGVAPADVRSTDLSITPTFTPSGRISGYQVSNMILVTLHDLVHAGQVIDTAASSVGNAIRIDGLTFAVSDTGNVDGQARAAAVSSASAHARAMARAAGESLGGICSVSDTTTGPFPQPSAGYAASNQTSAAGLPVPLEPGTQQASAQVTVVYALTAR